MIKVVIADDHAIVVDGLVSLLKDESDIDVVYTANNGKLAFEYIQRNPVDIAVLDINMPELNGVEATKEIKTFPTDTKVLILSMYNSIEFVDDLLEAGCSGYILKNKGQEELVKAIRTIYSGEEYYGKEVIQTMISGKKTPEKKTPQIPVKLTNRELEVLKLIAQEYTTPEIAKKLSRAETTIDTHRRNLISKLDVKSSLGLVAYAYQQGIVSK